MNPKISIIVPVYKVELYLEKCIDSILNQTFKDFELILVDDGSPDRCGEICDEYAKKDNRIKVIHKENGGQASARNLGLDIAKGEYIGFVDSDDWIEANMYEVLYNLCCDNQAEISCISSKIIYPQKTIIRENSELKKFTRDEAMYEVFRGKYFDEVVWSKIFKREIISNVRFKEGVKYEDTDFTYKVIYNCNNLVYEGKPLYNYLIRNGSTMFIAAQELSIDHVYIYSEMLEFYTENYPDYKEVILVRILDCALPVLNQIIKTNTYKKNKKKFNEVRDILNIYLFKFLKISKINRNIKFLLILLKIEILLYIIAIKILEKKK